MKLLWCLTLSESVYRIKITGVWLYTIISDPEVIVTILSTTFDKFTSLKNYVVKETLFF